jgi:hypothetical protein
MFNTRTSPIDPGVYQDLFRAWWADLGPFPQFNQEEEGAMATLFDVTARIVLKGATLAQLGHLIAAVDPVLPGGEVVGVAFNFDRNDMGSFDGVADLKLMGATQEQLDALRAAAEPALPAPVLAEFDLIEKQESAAPGGNSAPAA